MSAETSWEENSREWQKKMESSEQLPEPSCEDTETDAAVHAFWRSQLQLRQREDECAALGAQCAALRRQVEKGEALRAQYAALGAQCVALRRQAEEGEALRAQYAALGAECTTLRRQIEEEEATRHAAIEAAVRARDCALGMRKDNEDHRHCTHVHVSLCAN